MAVRRPKKIRKETLEEYEKLIEETKTELENAKKIYPTLTDPEEKKMMKQIIKMLEHDLYAPISGLIAIYNDLKEEYERQQKWNKLWEKIKCNGIKCNDVE